MSNAVPLPTAVIFDLDGVVVDSRAATAEALASIATRELGRRIDAGTVAVIGPPHRILQRLGVADAYNVCARSYDIAFERAGHRVRMFDEVVAGLNELKGAGVSLGAVTAQPLRRVRTMLPAHVAGLFDCIFTYNDTKGKKEVGIALALRRMGVAPWRCMYIGDQPADLEAARNAKVKGVGVLWGFSNEIELRQRPHDLILVEPRQVGPGMLHILSSS
jgi:phosphoglycolate phosphatase-like HAD superfamily hydrolase